MELITKSGRFVSEHYSNVSIKMFQSKISKTNLLLLCNSLYNSVNISKHRALSINILNTKDLQNIKNNQIKKFKKKFNEHRTINIYIVAVNNFNNLIFQFIFCG